MSGDVWRIEKIVPGGAGMARLEGGLIGFAEGALPGETIEVLGREARKGHVRATSFRVLEAAPGRVESPCVYASAGCGCDFMHVASEQALTHKVEALRDALARIGKFSVLPEIEVYASAQPLGYRSRLRVHLAPGGRVGYHARGTHRLIEFTSCKVARPELERALECFRRAAREHARAAAEFSEAELRVTPTDPRPVCHLMPHDRRHGSTANAFVRALQQDFHVCVGEAASEHVQRFPITERVCLYVPPRAFVQVNWEVNLQMIGALVRRAERVGARSFLDLYAGAGNFALALVNAGFTGVAVESDVEAIRAAERAFAEQNLAGGRVLAKDSLRALQDYPALADVDLVILDPPRAGAKLLLPELVSARPRHIAYFSCDPVTLARDLERLTASGYALESLAVFDMFPGTHHVETLAWLS